MISFYPGPSQLAPGIETWMQEACATGILTMNHRSRPFMDLYQSTCRLLREKLHIPADYHIVFTSSATECWEILTQSFPGLSQHHFYSGAFGEKWYNYAARLSECHSAHQFSPEEYPSAFHIEPRAGLLCFTQCETSNGSAIPVENSWNVLNPETLVAIDATASLGGDYAPVNHADIWFASVQKCFGLPSGMGLMLLSERAVKKAYELDERGHYNSLAFILDNERKFQTPYTPNILAIFLMNRVLAARPEISTINAMLSERMVQLSELIATKNTVRLLIQNPSTRSSTVCAVKGAPGTVKAIKEQAAENGMILGNGYGSLKETTFRIANFPALQPDHWEKLMKFIEKFIN